MVLLTEFLKKGASVNAVLSFALPLISNCTLPLLGCLIDLMFILVTVALILVLISKRSRYVRHTIDLKKKSFCSWFPCLCFPPNVSGDDAFIRLGLLAFTCSGLRVDRFLLLSSYLLYFHIGNFLN